MSVSLFGVGRSASSRVRTVRLTLSECVFVTGTLSSVPAPDDAESRRAWTQQTLRIDREFRRAIAAARNGAAAATQITLKLRLDDCIFISDWFSGAYGPSEEDEPEMFEGWTTDVRSVVAEMQRASSTPPGSRRRA